MCLYHCIPESGRSLSVQNTFPCRFKGQLDTDRPHTHPMLHEASGKGRRLYQEYKGRKCVLAVLPSPLPLSSCCSPSRTKMSGDLP
jgi:hypothetical protein